jgi:hypothetical protein
VFRFPYPVFDAVLTDVNRLHSGNVHLVWDDEGNPIKAPRDKRGQLLRRSEAR